MSLSRRTTLSAALAVQCLLGAWAAEPAAAAGIPDYFFREWTIAQSCAEAHAGLAARVQSGLKFQIARNNDGTFSFLAEDVGQSRWAANWNGMKLQYRAGTPMTSVPADFVCIPGEESSSPFLAMSGYAQATEPQYEQEHWYGLATIEGQLEHVLIFPRKVKGESGAIIVLESVTAPDAVHLDDDGVILGNG